MTLLLAVRFNRGWSQTPDLARDTDGWVLSVGVGRWVFEVWLSRVVRKT